MIEQVANATREAFQVNQLPWLLSAVTDWSYEEGSAKSFVAYTRLFEACGTPQAISARMRLGINGYLEQAFPKFGLSVTDRRVNNGYDFTILDSRGGTADIESKLSYDCTLKKYYSEISQDRERLQRGNLGEAYQIIFIVSLPEYRYPSGFWNGKHYPKRQTVNLGLDSQWAAIQEKIPCPTSWNDGLPVTLKFDDDEKEKAKCLIDAYFAHVFRPDSHWSFDLAHLRDAAVSIAIWKWR